MTKKLNVKESMLNLNEFPVLNEKIILKEVLEEMSNFTLGIACIVDKNFKLIGIITDGDIRRKILKIQKPFSALLNDDISKHITKNPTTTSLDKNLIKALREMQKKKIWDLPVKNKKGKLIGLIHFHSIIKNLIRKKLIS
tara:strand:- start:183 stop:602 length:420 start_codon:yes stop_codon:yes gene_type:complete